MRIVVVAVGRLRPPYADDVRHYQKLIAGHARLELLEVREDAHVARRVPDRAFVSLLHPRSQEQLQNPETWAYLIDNLKHEKQAIRELAYYHLRKWVPAAQWQKINYNPADPPERREMACREWKKLIPDGKLPPAGQSRP